jgi:predicted ribosomally synthesized peptide with nif11-like leader
VVAAYDNFLVNPLKKLMPMSSADLQDFYQKFANYPEFRQKISQAESMPQLIAILQEWGCHLTGAELMTLAQQAYQTWIAELDRTQQLQSFFLKARENQELNKLVETCNHPDDVIALAQAYGFQLSEEDLKIAAEVTHKIEGFSFEKLWFKKLGLL